MVPHVLQDKRMDYRSILTRSALVSSINSMNLLGLVPPEVRVAYELLTSEFNPLELCKKLDPLLASLEVRGGDSIIRECGFSTAAADVGW
jgi:hypothetical protein